MIHTDIHNISFCSKRQSFQPPPPQLFAANDGQPHQPAHG